MMLSSGATLGLSAADMVTLGAVTGHEAKPSQKNHHAISSAGGKVGGPITLNGPHAPRIHSAGGKTGAGGKAMVRGPHAHAFHSAGGKASINKSMAGKFGHLHPIQDK